MNAPVDEHKNRITGDQCQSKSKQVTLFVHVIHKDFSNNKLEKELL